MSVPMGLFFVSGWVVSAALAGSPGGGNAATVSPAEPVHADLLHADRVLQIRARELWTAGGKRVQGGLLVVADGRIRSAGEGQPDPRQPMIQHDGVVTAGLIACRTKSGSAGELQDDTRTLLPAARAAHAFDADSRDFERALSAGITALALAPNGESLVGGLGCVVKTAGGRVLDAEATLVLSLSSSALGRSTVQGGFVFGSAEEELSARPDGGPETTAQTARGSRAPTGYAGAVATLKQLFAREDGPFEAAREGELPVTIEAWDRHEVLRAARLARELGLTGAIRGAPLAGDPDVLAMVKASGLGVIVGPYAADQTRPSLESVAKLAAAGVPVGFALDAPAHSPAELRLFAARALWAGAARDAVWKALTEDAARLSGVGDSIGALDEDRDADFVLWSGDPLDLSSRVVSVYVDGELAWPAPARPPTR